MSPNPYRPRDIVRVVASVNHTLHNFFYDNSRLSAASGTPGPKRSETVPSPPGGNKSKGGPVRPGVILGVSSDHATVAMFTTLRGKGLSGVKGFLRPIVAPIRSANQKCDVTTPGWPHPLAIHPAWPVTGAAKQALCICLRHEVPIHALEPWIWKDEEPTMMAGEKLAMCRSDFRELERLCERNEGLRGLLASDSWLFEQLDLDDFSKRHD